MKTGLTSKNAIFVFSGFYLRAFCGIMEKV